MAEKTMKLGLILSATDKMSRVIEQATHKSTKSLEKVTERFNKMSTYALASGTAIVGGMFAMVKSTADEAKAIGLNAQKTGLAVESYQRLTHAAERFKIDNDTLTVAIARMSRTQVEAAKGNKKAQEAFKMAGVSIYDMNGKLKNANQIIMEVSEKFKNAPDGPKKAAVAMNLFGRSGFNLIPMLNKGKEGLTEMGDEAEKAGMVMSKKTVEDFKKFNRETHEMHEAMEASKRSIAITFLPAITRLMKRIAEITTHVRKFIDEHRTLVKWVVKLGIGLVILGGVIKTTISVIKLYKDAMVIAKLANVFFSDQLKTLKLRLLYAQDGITKFSRSAKLMAVWNKIVAAAQWIFNASLYGCPIVWIIAGIMAIIGVVVLIVKNWSKISAFFKRLWQNIKDMFMKAVMFIKDLFMKYTPYGIMLGLIIKHWAKIKAFFSNTVKSFGDFGRNIIKSLVDGIKSMITHPIKTITKVADGIKNKFKSIFGIHSPSKVFAEFGLNMNQGLAKGLDEGKSKSIAATQKLANSTSNTFQSKSSVNNSGVTLNYSPSIVIGSASQTDKESFAKMLKDHKREIVQLLKEINNNNARIAFA